MSGYRCSEKAIGPGAQCSAQPRDVRDSSAVHIGRGEDYLCARAAYPMQKQFDVVRAIAQIRVQHDDVVPQRVPGGEAQRLAHAEVGEMVEYPDIPVCSGETLG